MKDKKTRKPKKISWDISEDEFTSLVKKTPQMHHKTGFLLAWGSGLRLQEVLDLKEHCINFEKGTLKVIQGKNSKDRYTVIPHGFTKEYNLE